MFDALRRYSLSLALLSGCGGPGDYLDIDQTDRPTITSSLSPISNSTPNQWLSVPAGGYTAIDESACNSNTDYIEADTNGEESAFAIPLNSIPSGSLITQIMIYACANRPLSGTASLQLGYAFGGLSITYGTAHSVTSWVYSTKQTNMSVAVLKSVLTTMKVSVKSASSTSVRVSQLFVEIRYAQVPSGLHFNNQTLLVDGADLQSDVGWTNVSDNSGYRVEYSLNAGSSWSTAGDTATNVTSLLHTAAPVGTTPIRYRVRAKGPSGGLSNPSSEIIGMAAPSNLVVSRNGDSGASFSWTSNDASATRTRIYRLDDNNQIEQIGPDLAGNATSYSVSSGAEPGYYQVSVDALPTLHEQSSAAHDTYVPAPIVNYDSVNYSDDQVTQIFVDGGIYPASDGDDGTANVTTYTLNGLVQPWVSLPSVVCLADYSTNGGSSWASAGPDDIYDHVATPSSGGLQYRKRCSWDGVYSDYEYIYGIPAPLGLTVQANGGSTILNWNAVTEADDYLITWIASGIWSTGIVSTDNNEVISGTQSRTYHVFARRLNPAGLYDYSVASTNVTGP